MICVCGSIMKVNKKEKVFECWCGEVITAALLDRMDTKRICGECKYRIKNGGLSKDSLPLVNGELWCVHKRGGTDPMKRGRLMERKRGRPKTIRNKKE